MTSKLLEMSRNPSTSDFFSNKVLALMILGMSFIAFMASMFVPEEYFILALLAPIGGIVGIILVVRPQLLLIIIVAYFPLEGGTWFDPYLPGGLTIPKILGVLLLGVLIFNIIFRKEKFRFFDDALDYVIMAFCAAIVFSSIASLHTDQIIGEVDRVLRLVAFYVAVKNLVKTSATMRWLMVAFFLTSTYASMVGLNDYFTLTTEWGKRVRAAGINENPNNFAFASVMAIAVGSQLLVVSKNWFSRIFWVGAIGIVLLGLIYSGSRGGMLSGAVVISLIILRHPRRNQLILLGLLGAVLSFPFLPQDMKDRYFSFGSDSDFKSSQEESADASSERRLSYLQFGLGLIAENPIQGAGYRSFVILYPESEFIRFDNPVNEHDLNRVAHNVYLETFVGVGLLGTSAFVLMLFLAWRYFRRAIALLEPGTFAWATAQALEYALIAYCVSSIFISSEQFKQLWYILGMSSALLHYAMFLQNKKNSSNAPIRSSIAN